jgi:hypothetical protein
MWGEFPEGKRIDRVAAGAGRRQREIICDNLPFSDLYPQEPKISDVTLEFIRNHHDDQVFRSDTK